MTLSAAFRAGLARWPWLLGPVFVTAALAALIGAAVERRATYRVSRVLKVTEGAPAEAIFVCRSRDVLASAMERADLRPLVPPEELAGQVSVTEAGGGTLHLTVERSSKKEAEDLAEAYIDQVMKKGVPYRQAREVALLTFILLPDVDEAADEPATDS